MPNQTLVDSTGTALGSAAAPLRIAEVAGTSVVASATAAAAAACTATLAGVAGRTTYICGLAITTTNPAGIVSGIATVTGLGVTLNFQVVESTTHGFQLLVTFDNPVPASAANTAIVVTLPAITGGAASAVTAWGFQL